MNSRMTRIFLALACASAMVAFTGCKSKNAADDPFASGGVDALSGDDIFGSPLGGRPGDNVQYQEGLFPPVFFAYDSSEVQPSDRGTLEQVAAHLRQNASGGVLIEGHCDERGSREYNMALGERRALSVRAYLIGLGVDGGRIQTLSKGEEEPAVMGYDEGAFSQNRRGEFLFF